MLEQLTSYLLPWATLLVTLLVPLLAYIFGRWKTIHDRLIERRLDVIAALFERFEDMDQMFFSLVHPLDLGGEPDKKEKAKRTAESFNELQSYYRRNSIWLPRRTSHLINGFINRYRATFRDFEGEKGHPDSVRKWNKVWKRYEKEAPEIRERLETEFRIFLGERRARFRRLWLDARALRSKERT